MQLLHSTAKLPSKVGFEFDDAYAPHRSGKDTHKGNDWDGLQAHRERNTLVEVIKLAEYHSESRLPPLGGTPGGEN